MSATAPPSFSLASSLSNDRLSQIIDSTLFEALQGIDLDQMEGKDLAPVLPFLVKLLLNPAFVKRKQILKLLYPLRRTNDVIRYLQSNSADMTTNDANRFNPAVNFENGNTDDRLKLVLTEYIRIQERARLTLLNPNPNAKLEKSTKFDNPLYLDDISFSLYALLARSTTISAININDMCEALLHVQNGPTYIVRLIANIPDRCLEICHSLISYGESQDEGANFNEISQQRAKTLRMVCLMNPRISFTVRSITLQLCKMPSLAIMITLDHLTRVLENYETSEPRTQDTINELLEIYEEVISFIAGTLISTDDNTRVWFAQYIKSAQQKRIDQGHPSVLSTLRSKMLLLIKKLFYEIIEEQVPDLDESTSDVLQFSSEKRPANDLKILEATATLRLFCALRGIGMLKLNADESDTLLRLITHKPDANPATINFVTTGVCTLLTCSAVINNQKEERRAADWLKWLVKEPGFKDNSYSKNGKCSISELLLQIATHFQDNRTNQISELVCATLGMKLQIKASISKCKSLFIQEVFNEQIIAEHAVKAPVTKTLDNTSTEFLPIHCIHQLLESRSFNTLISINPEQNRTRFTTDQLKEQLENNFESLQENTLALVRTISNILTLPKDELWTFVDLFIENWPKMLELDGRPEHKKLVQVATELWWKFNTIQPRELWVMTINSLRGVQSCKTNTDVRMFDHSWDELTMDPLIVLRCDARVFRCPDALKIMLHVLYAFLAASKRFLQDHINEQSGRQKDSRNLEELRTTLVLAQTSAAIQILLEACSPSEEEQEILNQKSSGYDLGDEDMFKLDRYNLSVDCICEHLHQVFIEDTNLAKLVHFQTYPSELLAITSDRIPSMHICLDFIPELLSQPDLSKQIFVIELTSHLCEKYAITKSLNVAKLCFNFAFTLLQLLPSDKRALFYISVLPALLRISKVFPILQEDARIILSQINQITVAHLASTSSRLSLGSTRPFGGIEKMTWREVTKLMRTLSSNEALYLCIQKCLIDLNEIEEKERMKTVCSGSVGELHNNNTFAYNREGSNLLRQ